MQLKMSEAHHLVVTVLTQEGLSKEHGAIVADHLIDAATAGHAFAGLPRVIALVENLRTRPAAKAVKISHDTDNSILIDGGGNNGYVTSLLGIDEGISIAKSRGFALVGIRNTWFSGRLTYYVERAAREGLIAIHTANTQARVAPHGGIDRIFGTNPIAFAFPTQAEPLVVDFGTGMTTWGDALLRSHLGEPMEPDSAVGPDGQPTRDPASALAGAFLPWGGHRGYGLSLVVQVLALLCGSKIVVEDVADCGFFFLLFDPELLMPIEEFKSQVTALEDHIARSRPQSDVPVVRIPGRASARRRAEAQERGTIEVDDKVYEALMQIADEKVGAAAR